MSNDQQLQYLFSTQKREHLETYFKMKNKYGFCFSENERSQFVKDCIDFIGTHDLIIYPETSGDLLPEIAQMCAREVCCIKKNSTEKIKSAIFELKLMKSEKESLSKTFSSMGSTFELKKVKGNQRKRFIPYLFQYCPIADLESKSVLILDDAIFSSSTINALRFYYPNVKIKVIFSK